MVATCQFSGGHTSILGKARRIHEVVAPAPYRMNCRVSGVLSCRKIHRSGGWSDEQGFRAAKQRQGMPKYIGAERVADTKRRGCCELCPGPVFYRDEIAHLWWRIGLLRFFIRCPSSADALAATDPAKVETHHSDIVFKQG